MTSLKQSASTPSFASIALPKTNVLVMPIGRRNTPQPRAFTRISVGRMRCPSGKQEALFWDASCAGFGLRALSSGRRTWIYQYRDEHKRTRRIALGNVSAVSLDAARQAARQHAANVTQGANPSADRNARASVPTVLSIIEVYLLQAKARQRERSYEETERHLRKHAASIHYNRADATRRIDIATLLGRVSETSGPFAANRLRAALSALWSWGMRAGLIESESNPVTFTLRHPEKARERALSDDELRAVWAATEGDGDYLRIVRLCTLTGCRREEIGGLRWDEVLADRLLLGAGRMKGATAHEVPLLPAITDALPDRPADCEGSVFGRNGAGFSGWSKSKAALGAKLARGGVTMPRWTLHDLRRTFSTRLHDAGVEPLVIEALLAHKQQGVAGVYNRATFLDAKRAALLRWHEILLKLTDTNSNQAPVAV